MADDNFDDDLFADIYADDAPAPSQPKPVAVVPTPQPAPVKVEPAPVQPQAPAPSAITTYDGGQSSGYGDYGYDNGSAQQVQYDGNDVDEDGFGDVGIKEDG